MDYLTQKRTLRGSVHLHDSGRLFMSTARAKLDDELLPLTSRLSQKNRFQEDRLQAFPENDGHWYDVRLWGRLKLRVICHEL